MEIIILLSSLIANGLIKLMKRPKEYFAKEDLENRKLLLRMANAFIGVVTLLIASALTGQDINLTELQGFVEVIILGFITYLTSQGLFFTAKKTVNKPALQE